jgi:hypothetical protein
MWQAPQQLIMDYGTIELSLIVFLLEAAFYWPPGKILFDDSLLPRTDTLPARVSLHSAPPGGRNASAFSLPVGRR